MPTYADLAKERISRLQRGESATEVNRWFNREKARLHSAPKTLVRKPVPLDIHSSPSPIPHEVLQDPIVNDMVFKDGKYLI